MGNWLKASDSYKMGFGQLTKSLLWWLGLMGIFSLSHPHRLYISWSYIGPYNGPYNRCRFDEDARIWLQHRSHPIGMRSTHERSHVVSFSTLPSSLIYMWITTLIPTIVGLIDDSVTHAMWGKRKKIVSTKVVLLGHLVFARLDDVTGIWFW